MPCGEYSRYSPQIMRRIALARAVNKAYIHRIICGEYARHSQHRGRQMARYIYQQKGWPKFRWHEQRLLRPLARVRHRQGRLIGHMQGLGFSLRKEAELQTLT